MASASEIDPQPAGTFWTLDLQGALPEEIRPGVAARFARVGAEAVPTLAQAMGLPDVTLVLKRLAGQRRCYGAWVDGALVAYGWVTFDEEEIGELGVRVRLAPGEAYVWDCATLPAYRGQHLYPALLTHISRELYVEGFERILIGADTDNLPSQRGMMRAGFQPLADMQMYPARRQQRLCLIGRPGVLEEQVQRIRQALVDTEGGMLWAN
jgi:ribosomal protein S18 acetylase RimI-like enzyme